MNSNDTSRPTILYIHQHFKTLEMAGGTRSYELSRRLVDDGFDVIMLTADATKVIGKVKRNSINGMDVIWVPCAYNNKFGKYGKMLAFGIYSVVSCVYALRLKYDLCFATSTPLTAGIPALLAKKLRRKPYVFEVRDLWPELPIALGVVHNRLLIRILRRLEASIYRNASSLIGLSPGMSAGIQEVLDQSGARVPLVTAPNACDFDSMLSPGKAGYREQRQRVRESLKLPDDQILLLYAGTLGILNDMEFLVSLAGRCKANTQLHFLIVGDGIRSDALRASLSQHELSNVTVLGRVSKLDIVNFYAAADIGLSLFVDIPEMEKNSANKFFDTLAAGKPVVINYGGWQADFLEASGVGIQLDRNSESAARQLDEFSSDAWRIPSEVILEKAQIFSRAAIYLTVKEAIEIGFKQDR